MLGVLACGAVITTATHAHNNRSVEPRANSDSAYIMLYQTIADKFTERGEIQHDGKGNYHYIPRSENPSKDDHEFIVYSGTYYEYDKSGDTWSSSPNDGTAKVGFDPTYISFTPEFLSRFLVNATLIESNCQDFGFKCTVWENKIDGQTHRLVFNKKTGQIAEHIKESEGTITDYRYSYSEQPVISPPQNKQSVSGGQ